MEDLIWGSYSPSPTVIYAKPPKRRKPKRRVLRRRKTNGIKATKDFVSYFKTESRLKRARKRVLKRSQKAELRRLLNEERKNSKVWRTVARAEVGGKERAKGFLRRLRGKKDIYK